MSVSEAPESSKSARASCDGILLVDKPRGVTSHDVVRFVRRAVGRRDCGHAGTLDPMATGLLVIGVGEGRKLLRWLTGSDKRYLTTVSLGRATDSLDADGDVVAEAPVPALSQTQVELASLAFVGTFVQRVPDVSAVKRGGETLYARFRRGEAVEAPEREVTVRRLSILAVRPTEIDLDVECAKGFYVRALGADLARALGTLGHLVALRRLASGAFDVGQATDFESVRRAAAGDVAARALIAAAVVSIERALPGAPRLTLDAQGRDDASHGRLVASARVIEGAWPTPGVEPVLLLGPDGHAVALARADVDGLHVMRGFSVPAAATHST